MKPSFTANPGKSRGLLFVPLAFFALPVLIAPLALLLPLVLTV
jgi:hypothetical protein